MIIIYAKHKNSKPPIPNGRIAISEFPYVTVQLPIYNEKLVAERLIKTVSMFEWPHDRLEIQILDDSTDETSDIIKRCIDNLNNNNQNLPLINYIHRTDRTGYKAGALAEGLKIAKGEFIAIFDADNLPNKDFLTYSMRFFNDKRIGMVQTRWGFLNSNESFLCRAQTLFLNAHFIVEQQARYFGGLLFNFNGTAGIWRKETIADAGGWQFDTLTEDLDLSMRAQLQGWKFIYDNSYIVPTELPNRISAFKSQQYRWAKGAVETAIKLLPTILKSSLPLKVKIASFFHLTSKSISPVLLMLALLLVPALYIRMESGLLKLFLIDFPIFIAGTGSMSLFYSYAYKHGNSNKGWKDIFTLPMLTSLGIALAVNNSKAFFSALLLRKSAFIRTPKSGSTDALPQEVPTSYFATIDKTVFLELFLTCYSFSALLIAFDMHLYFTLPFLATFFIGYLYFSYKGVRELYVK